MPEGNSTFFARLVNIVGEENLICSPTETRPYLEDWRGRYHGAACAVARPADTEQTAAVVRCCLDARIPITPQGGNTSLCGSATPDQSGRSLLLSMSRLKRIRLLDTVNNTLTAEAGCVLADLQQAAEREGRLFPLSLAAEGSCQLGGNLSTNAGGVQVLRYGNTRELTLGMEVVLPNGEIWHGLRALRKDNTGYDLKQLFIGAEGTLGIITAAVLRLFPAVRQSQVCWLAAPSPAAALLCLTSAQLTFGAALSACELISRSSFDLVLQHIPGAIDPFSCPYPWCLLLQIDNTEVEQVENWIARGLENAELQNAVLAQSGEQARKLWHLRESISEAQKKEGLSIKHDIALPVAAIPEFLQRAERELNSAFTGTGLRIVAFGHLGDGNLHYNLSCLKKDANDDLMAREKMANTIVYDLVDSLGGSISAEHGLGQLKRETICRYKSEVEMELMRSIKRTIDPLNLMNPGKLL